MSLFTQLVRCWANCPSWPPAHAGSRPRSVSCRVLGNLVLLSGGIVWGPIFILLPLELSPVRPLPAPSHCVSRAASGYKAQGSAIWCHPSAMTSRAQLQPKRPRSTRNRQDFEAKNPNSFSFLLFLRLHVPLLSVFFASLFLSILKRHTIVCLMYTRNLVFTNVSPFEYTPSVK